MLSLLTNRYPGMRIWLSQRITAMVMMIYLFAMLIAWIVLKPVGYEAWIAFTSSIFFIVPTYVCFFCLVIHAWVGVRDVLRDYVFNQRLRGWLQVLVDMCLVAYLIWMFIIFWSIY